RFFGYQAINQCACHCTPAFSNSRGLLLDLRKESTIQALFPPEAKQMIVELRCLISLAILLQGCALGNNSYNYSVQPMPVVLNRCAAGLAIPFERIFDPSPIQSTSRLNEQYVG